MKKVMYFSIACVLIFLFSFSYGYLVFKNKIFPFSTLKNLFGTKTGSYIMIEKAKKKELV